MKEYRQNIYIVICLLGLVCFGCKKLKRDNPLDSNGTSLNTPAISGPDVKFSKYDIYADNNSDLQINKGESIKLKVYLKNTGSTKANKVRGIISCSSNYISALTPANSVSFYDQSYNDYIDSGAEGSPVSISSYLSFNVSNTVPNGTIITFSVTITDDSNNTWKDVFTITIAGTNSVIGFSKYEIYSDNNADMQINKGESIKLKVFLKNNGSSKANKVRVTISCTNNYISALSPATSVSFFDQSYNDYISPGDEGSPTSISSYLSFNVSNTTPSGSTITFTLTITDETNNTWTDTFTINVIASSAVIKYSRNDIYSDNNNNQQINAGESIKLKIYLKNLGSSKANKVRGTISCANSYISALSPVTSVSYFDQSYNDYISAGNEGSPTSVSSYLSFNVSVSTPSGTTVIFNVSITDESSNTWLDTFTITVN